MSLWKFMKALEVGVVAGLAAMMFWLPMAQAQGKGDNPSPPEEPIKLIFIHHSVGEDWLTDDYGGLGLALQENNYFVSDTNYGWGPDGIGDLTDTLDWPEWFLGPNSDRFMAAVYNESRANAAGWEYYSRDMSDPGGENQIIMFKSCYPNSDIFGSPNDPPQPDDDLTVGAAKYIYNQLLEYFITRPDKLFVVVTAPPMQNPEDPENARAFNTWLVNDWLMENDYPYSNVAVWDFYNVLTHPENHHRFNNGSVEYTTRHGNNTLYYDSWGDDHPNEEGSRKATTEFVPMLNVFYNNWQAGNPPISPSPQEIPDSSERVLVSSSMIDDFESGSIPESDYWVPYWDEEVATSISCNPNSDQAYSGNSALEINFNVMPQSWASCEMLHYEPQDWSGGEGLSFYLQASQPGIPMGLMFYWSSGDILSSIVVLESTQESVDGWAQITVPWSEFVNQDTPVDPGQGLGVAFLFDGGENEASSGTVWIDDMGVTGKETSVDVQDEHPEAPMEGEPGGENAEESQEEGRAVKLCGNIPGIVFVVLLGAVLMRKRKI